MPSHKQDDTRSGERRGETARRRDSMTTSGESRQPRLPQEIDESAHSQHQGEPRRVIQQAHEDLVQGRQDTSRKPEIDRAYEQQKGPGAAGTAAAAPDRSGAGVNKTDAGHGPGDRKSASVGRKR